MVAINHCVPHQLNAYPTIPLAQSVAASVQQDFAIGSFARFGNPSEVISIQDRPDFHGASHYSIREKLDLEGFLEEFLIIDDRTADSHAIWYVETTENSKQYTALAIGGDEPPITYPGEDFTLWQARILTQDVPIQWGCFEAGVRDLEDDIESYNHPYDPHNPQPEPFTLALNFSLKEDVQGFLLEAHIEAEFREINWSTDMDLRKQILPNPPVVVKLTAEAARDAGLLSVWRPAQKVPRPGETISTTAPYDWDSPKWSQGGTNVSKRGRSTLSLISPATDVGAGTCGPAFGGLRRLSSASRINALPLGNKMNGSQT